MSPLTRKQLLAAEFPNTQDLLHKSEAISAATNNKGNRKAKQQTISPTLNFEVSRKNQEVFPVQFA